MSIEDAPVSTLSVCLCSASMIWIVLYVNLVSVASLKAVFPVILLKYSRKYICSLNLRDCCVQNQRNRKAQIRIQNHSWTEPCHSLSGIHILGTLQKDCSELTRYFKFYTWFLRGKVSILTIYILSLIVLEDINQPPYIR